MSVGTLSKPNARPPLVEAAAAASAVAIVLMLIVPLPSALLDMLLTLNITLSVGILLVTFYVRRPLEFSSFPSMLLLVTLFRLALNVSSTRLILGQGAAGTVIAAFGSFVIGGNFVVGIVVFSVLIVIQFVVITSGASRVSEVAARFTLDAMPGKQMAIDAELNSGAIDEATARVRRQEVSREADFYGAMDGASKFVRGDAIAAVIMIAINILGGFAVGVLQRGMDIGGALQTYTLLTVGEGLATQLPALLISAASGLLVTRTASDASLGKELSGQLVAHPQAVLVASGAVAILGLAPGIPKVPFLVLAAGIALLARQLQRQQSAARVVPAPVQRAPENLADVLEVDPLEIELGYGLVCLADAKQGGDLLERVTGARRQIATELGIVVPPIRVHDNIRLKANQYVFRMRGTEIGAGEILPTHLLALDGGAVQQPLVGVPTRDPAFGLPAVWVPTAQRVLAEVAGYTVAEPTNVLVTHVTELLRRFAPEVLSRQEVQGLVETAKRTSPAVVDELIPNLLTLGQVQKVLQLLLRERVSVRDLAVILEALADAAPATRDPEVLVEHVRQRLCRQLTRQFAEADSRLVCFTLHPAVEQVLADSVRRTDAGTQVVIEPDTQAALVERVRGQAERMVAAGHQPVVLCSPRVRALVRAMCERAVPTLVAMSYPEVAAGTSVEALGTVRWDDEDPTL